MTLAELYTKLNSGTFTGKVAYNAFPVGEAPSLPYICIVCTSTDNFGADNKVYFKRQNVNIELYTELKDPTTESAIESVLDSNEVFYEATDTYLDDERCFERIYEIEV